jgi:hypothetical protein
VVLDWITQFPDAVERKEAGWSARHEELAERHGAQSDEAGLALARAWVSTIGG